MTKREPVFGLRRLEQVMARLGAEMRHVDLGHRVARPKPRDLGPGRAWRGVFAGAGRAGGISARWRRSRSRGRHWVAWDRIGRRREGPRECDANCRVTFGAKSLTSGTDVRDRSLRRVASAGDAGGADRRCAEFSQPLRLADRAALSRLYGGHHARRGGRQPGGRAEEGAARGTVFRAGPVDGVHLPGLHRVDFRAVFPAEPDPAGAGRGGVIIVFGLHFLGVINIPILNREARLDAGDRGGSALGAYILGLAFAFGWTPCIGPQLGAILSIAATEASVQRGTTLLGVMPSGSASRSCWRRPISTGPWR
jgi:hypothetical protein